MDSSTRGGATRTNPAQQERILAEWDQTGISGVDFARSRGVKVEALYRWRTLQRNRPAAPEAPSTLDFVKLTINPKGSTSATAPMNVHLRDGIRVEVSEAAQLDWVAALSQNRESIAASLANHIPPGLAMGTLV